MTDFDPMIEVPGSVLTTYRELKEAVLPLAALADKCDELGHPDDSTCEWRLRAGDLRRIRRLILPDESVIEDGSTTARPARMSDYDSPERQYTDPRPKKIEKGMRFQKADHPPVWVVDSIEERGPNSVALMKREDRVGSAAVSRVPVTSLLYGDAGWSAVPE